MKWKRILIIVGCIIIGFPPLINVLTIAILGFERHKYWMAGIALGLLILSIGLLSVETETMSTVGGIIMLISMVYSWIILPKFFLKKKVPAAVNNYIPGRISQSFPESSQTLHDVLNSPSEPIQRILVNEALEDTLCNLPLITLIDAKKIVDERSKNGPYRDAGDLQKRNGLSLAVMNKIGPSLDFRERKQEENPNIGSRKIDF